MKVNLSAWKAERNETGGIQIETDDETFSIADPRTWSDDVQALVAKTRDGGNETDSLTATIELVTAVIGGPETYARFVAAGGSAIIASQLIQEAQGVTPGESADS